MPPGKYFPSVLLLFDCINTSVWGENNWIFHLVKYICMRLRMASSFQLYGKVTFKSKMYYVKYTCVHVLKHRVFYIQSQTILRWHWTTIYLLEYISSQSVFHQTQITCKLEDIIGVCGGVSMIPVSYKGRSQPFKLCIIPYSVYVINFIVSLDGFINGLTSKQRTYGVECTVKLKSL